MGGCNGGRGYTKWGRWVGLDFRLFIDSVMGGVALYGVVLSWDLWWVSWWGDGLGYEFFMS